MPFVKFANISLFLFHLIYNWSISVNNSWVNIWKFDDFVEAFGCITPQNKCKHFSTGFYKLNIFYLEPVAAIFKLHKILPLYVYSNKNKKKANLKIHASQSHYHKSVSKILYEYYTWKPYLSQTGAWHPATEKVLYTIYLKRK